MQSNFKLFITKALKKFWNQILILKFLGSIDWIFIRFLIFSPNICAYRLRWFYFYWAIIKKTLNKSIFLKITKDKFSFDFDIWKNYWDHRDHGPLLLSPILLDLGAILPILLNPSSDRKSLPNFIGILTVGIGDSFATLHKVDKKQNCIFQVYNKSYSKK